MVRFLRAGAPKEQSARTAIADYAPTIGALTGLIVGLALPAPDVVDHLVAGLGIAMALVGFLLLGVSWPKRWIGRPQVAMTARTLAVHLTIVPALLGLATLAGVELPPAVWMLALGPIPTSVVSFARVYGYSPRTAATGLAISIGGRDRAAAARADARRGVGRSAAQARPSAVCRSGRVELDRDLLEDVQALLGAALHAGGDDPVADLLRVDTASASTASCGPRRAPRTCTSRARRRPPACPRRSRCARPSRSGRARGTRR